MSNKVTFTVSRFLASGTMAETRTYQRGYSAGLRLEAMAHDMVRANAGLDTQDGHRVMEDASHAVESVLRGGMVSHTVWARGARVVISRATVEPEAPAPVEPAPMVAQPVQQAQCNAAPLAAPVAAPGAPRVSFAPFTAFRAAVRAGAYVWPGGYPLVGHMSDDGTLCPRCMKYNRRNILESLASGHRDSGWHFAACNVHWEGGPVTCDDCNAEIESAYGVPDEVEPADLDESDCETIETAPARAYTIDDAERDLADFTSRHPEPVPEIASDGPPAATVIHSAQSIRDAINPAHLTRISEASPDLYSLLSEISRLSADEHGNPVPVTLDEETRDNIRAVLSWCEGLI